MTIREAIQQLEQFADQIGDGAAVKLYDRTNATEFAVEPDLDVFDFEILRGDSEIVIEFN